MSSRLFVDEVFFCRFYLQIDAYCVLMRLY